MANIQISELSLVLDVIEIMKKNHFNIKNLKIGIGVKTILNGLCGFKSYTNV
jgi:hypothetical protein